MWIKHEDAQLVQIQEEAGILGGKIISTMVAYVSVFQKLQQAVTDLGQDLAIDVIPAIKELDGVASTCLGHILHLAASSFKSLSVKRRKEKVNKSWGSINGLMGMLKKNYPFCLGTLFKGNVESIVSTYFDKNSDLTNSTGTGLKILDILQL